MALIAGSPLGLVGLNSSDNASNSFDDYNKRTRGTAGDGSVSLFSGGRILRPFGIGVKKSGSGSESNNPSFDKNNAIHSNKIYDTSIENIVDSLEGTRAELKLMDFAYLRDVGVYPNNRLMIARRFATPVEDNIMYNNDGGVGNSIVTMIGWKPISEDFLEISFGEKWKDVGSGSFTSILNDVGGDFKLKGLGDYAEAGANAIPLPGSTETLQRKVLAKLGILDSNSVDQIPEGNPNLIKEAKQRTLVEAGQPGSGLTCEVSIKMVCVWEQKYIKGIDPTLAWMDIIAMIGRFGTSTSQTYGLSQNLGSKVKGYLDNPSTLVAGVIAGITEAVNGVIEKIKSSLIDAKTALGFGSEDDEDIKNKQEELKKSKIKEKNEGLTNSINNLSTKFGETTSKIGTDILNTITKKYRERIIGVTNALTGLPSTPWHITLGNPLRPTFCSGDMYTTSVKLNLGSSLSFNDLPTKITAEFTLKNARPWGLQEIMAKFNSGYLRVLSYTNDDKGQFDKIKTGQFTLGDSPIQPKPVKTDSTSVTQTTPNQQLPTDTPSVDGVDQVNSDPNSTLPII